MLDLPSIILVLIFV